MKHINPLTFQLPDDKNKNEAADLIRGKIERLYANEPDVLGEAIESVRPGQHSKHQKFVAELASSGKPFAVIQTEWHEYYQGLSDNEKHEVWNEFYSAQQSVKPQFSYQSKLPHLASYEKSVISGEVSSAPKISRNPKTVSKIRKQIQGKVAARGKLTANQHLKSLMFGLGAGVVTVMFLLLGLFNERIVAPFITPSRNVGDTPLISAGGTVGNESKLVIPKINLEVPVVYDVETIDEPAVQEGLERGVVHYATTSNPGELGNGAIFGHSSNNLLNRGKYKFAFVLLSRLEKDDTFFVEKDGVRYIYKVFDKKIVSPQEVSVLSDVPDREATMALITCDPPGTTINRLVVWGEQISPDPSSNSASTALKTDDRPEILASNAESLWSRIWNSVF